MVVSMIMLDDGKGATRASLSLQGSELTRDQLLMAEVIRLFNGASSPSFRLLEYWAIVKKNELIPMYTAHILF